MALGIRLNRSEIGWGIAGLVGLVISFNLGNVIGPLVFKYVQPVTVPEVVPKVVASLPPSTSTDENFDLLKDISVFDLRGWKPVPASEEGNRYSPVNFTNYLHIRKKRPVEKYVAHFATSGTAIDMRSITHQATLLKADSKEHPNERSYALEIDLSAEEVGSEFIVVVEGTYWNGFRDETRESALTYTDNDIGSLGELGLLVILPPSKPLKTFELLTKAKGKDFVPMAAATKIYTDNKSFAYWSVTNRKPDMHYKLAWTW